MVYLIIPITVLLWLYGGQINKSARRFGIPTIPLMFTLFDILFSTSKFAKEERKHFKKKDIWAMGMYMLLMPILSLGYGQDSWLRKLLGGSDTWTRIVYALILSIPLIVISIITNQDLWEPIVTPITMVGAFSIKAGGIKIGRYDLLFEDCARSSVFGGGIVLLFT